jgi:7,8-dihydropterin-6-yl-methyl-4-(beta-D-ribofuranosyl)aminobenzene 5'-phosphate synthase
MEASMLFGGCNCGPGSLVSAYGSLCAGGAGFVSAMIGAMVANARTANAPELNGTHPPQVRDRPWYQVLGEGRCLGCSPAR